MAVRNRHKAGDWLYACQRCGRTYYASQTRKEWTSLRVCGRCWEPRHPQDFVRGKKDDIVPPFASEPSDTDIDTIDIIVASDGEPIVSWDLEPTVI